MESEAKSEEKGAAFVARSCWPWVMFAGILLAFVATVIWLRPTANFGSLQDDAMYFASAKSIATGHGYMLPSFPGHLPQLKYPELYPWLLSWVWRASPNFPSNVVPAIGLTLIFACWFLIACFLVAKRTLRLEAGWALVVTALCGFNFFSLLLAGSVLSDLPFAALALTAVLCADRALERDADWKWAAAAGALAGVSVGLRTVGAALIAGIVVVAVLRRRWRPAVVCCVVGGALSLPWILPVFERLLSPHAGPASASPGWSQTLAFYTSYLGVWSRSVPNWATQRAVLLKNSLSTILAPGILLLVPLANHSAILSVGVGGAVAIAAWIGLFLHIRRHGWKSIYGFFLFYLAMVLPWPFPPQRFLVPLLPIFFGGLALIAREIARNAARVLREPATMAKRTGAVAAYAGLVALAGVVAANGAWAAPSSLARLMTRQRSLLASKRQAYRWIASNTPTSARFIAYDDVLLYLYTGRQSIRPIAPSTASGYDNDPAIAQRDAAHLADVARHVGAKYWLVTPGDFGIELGDDKTILRKRENELLAHLPIVFQCDSGRIRLYQLSNLNQPGANLP
jgi:4-amino-4-deoxy-L-arabinose transferase-like glycosyltransferase